MKEKFYLISVDAGASKKINKLGDYLYSNGWTNFEIIQCNKKRNLSNGKIEKFEVFANDLQGLPCLISDDIADGGASFIFASQALKAKNAGDVYLFVTHGIFSFGFDELKKSIKHIYTTNSFKDVNDPYVTQFNIDL